MRRWSCFRCTWSTGSFWATGRPFLIAVPAPRLRVVLMPLAVLCQHYPAPMMRSEEVVLGLNGRREVRNAYGAGATSLHSTSAPTCTRLADAWSDQAVVEAKEEERGRPLPDEDGPIVLPRELEYRGDSDRAQRRPVPRFLGHIVRNAKKGLLRIRRLVLRVCHRVAPFKSRAI